MFTHLGQVRHYATTSESPFLLVSCETIAAAKAVDVRSQLQHLVQQVDAWPEEHTDHDTTSLPAVGN